MGKRISIYEKIQTMAIKNKSEFMIGKYGEYNLITEKHWGVFIKPEDLLLDPRKFKEINTDCLPDFASLLSEYEEAIRATECYWYTGNKLSIKLVDKSSGNKEVFVNLAFLKQFGNNIMIHIKNEKNMVILTTRNHTLLGFIMPIMVDKNKIF